MIVREIHYHPFDRSVIEFTFRWRPVLSMRNDIKLTLMMKRRKEIFRRSMKVHHPIHRLFTLHPVNADRCSELEILSVVFLFSKSENKNTYLFFFGPFDISMSHSLLDFSTWTWCSFLIKPICWSTFFSRILMKKSKRKEIRYVHSGVQWYLHMPFCLHSRFNDSPNTFIGWLCKSIA